MVYKLDKYRAEAKVEPFELDLGDGQSISIQPPTVEDVILIGETPLTDGRRVLQLMCGDQFEALWAAVADLPGSMITPLVVDMAKHFGISAMQATPGGFRALPR